MIRLMLIVSLLGSAATAEQLDGPAFEAYVTGKTLGFDNPDGTIFGRESYFGGRRVIWSAAPTQCLHGRWFEDDGAICFSYENDPNPKCWIVLRTDEGITAQSVGPDGTGSGMVLSQAEILDTPLPCPGPDLLS